MHPTAIRKNTRQKEWWWSQQKWVFHIINHENEKIHWNKQRKCHRHTWCIAMKSMKMRGNCSVMFKKHAHDSVHDGKFKEKYAWEYHIINHENEKIHWNKQRKCHRHTWCIAMKSMKMRGNCSVYSQNQTSNLQCQAAIKTVLYSEVFMTLAKSFWFGFKKPSTRRSEITGWNERKLIIFDSRSTIPCFHLTQYILITWMTIGSYNFLRFSRLCAHYLRPKSW